MPSVQLNGDFECVLNASHINAAIQKQQPRRAHVEPRLGATRNAPNRHHQAPPRAAAAGLRDE